MAVSGAARRLGCGALILLAVLPPVRAEGTTISIQRNPPPVAPPAPLSAAHAAYLEGDLGRAGDRYRDALRRDPASAEASNGLASVALRENRIPDAIAWFRHSLSISPDDALAHARLADLDTTRRPEEIETRLRRHIVRQPDSAHLRFALGNALARQRRWAEAQQAYFEGHGLDPDDPDLLFNLATTLDRLHQPKAAQDFYRRALAAAQRHPAVFDQTLAALRLHTLEQP